MADKSKFGEFDLGRKLTDYEIENFNEFMKAETPCEIDASTVSLKEATKRNINLIKKDFTRGKNSK